MKKMNKKAFLLLTMVVALLTVSVGGTLAYLVTSTQAVTNVFTPGEVNVGIDEERDGNTKKDVKVTNSSDSIKAYIRAMIVVTWQDASGNVYPKAPQVNTDYTININTGDWTLENGFYYYKEAVNPGGATTNLINTCSPVVANIPDGYSLHVEIIAQAIQADGWPANANVTNAQSAFAEAAK